MSFEQSEMKILHLYSKDLFPSVYIVVIWYYIDY